MSDCTLVLRLGAFIGTVEVWCQRHREVVAQVNASGTVLPLLEEMLEPVLEHIEHEREAVR